VELVVSAQAAGDRAAGPCAQTLASLAPAAVRDAFRSVRTTAGTAMRTAVDALLSRVPIPPPHRVRLEVLGRTVLERDGQAVDDRDWRRERVRHLALVLAAHREIRRQRVGTMLWPDFDEDAVSANLRMTMTYLQALLEPHRGRGDAPWFLRQEAGVLRLHDDAHLAVDAWEVEALLDEAERATAPSVELRHLLAAFDRWKGEYLEEAAGIEWAEPFRVRFHRRIVAAGVRAGELLVADGRTAQAERVAGIVLSVDPWSEAAHRVLIRARLATGDRPGARRAFDACTDALAELGVVPTEETLGLVRSLT
jgi:DNA-binding SARP family transcriptional activator